MNIRFLAEAQIALSDISDYYASKSPQAHKNIIADINAALDTLITFPESGHLWIDDLRRCATVKYSFVITYRYRDNIIEIIDIYRHQNRS